MAEDVRAPDIPNGGKYTPNIDNHSESKNATDVLVGPEGGSKDEDANRSASKIPRSSPSVFEVRKSLAVTTRRLQQLLRDSAGQDSILASIEYLTHALHYLTVSHQWIKLWNALTNLLYRWRSRNTQAMPNRLARDPEEHSALLNLSILFSSARYTLRLFGLFNIWTEVPDLFQYPVRDRLIRGIDVVQIFTITIYQLLENTGHLTSNRILSPKVIGSRIKIERFYIWSARALFLHFALEVMKIAREARLAKLARTGSKGKNATSVEFYGDMLGQNWGRRLWASSIWGLLCLYWSCGQAVPLMEQTSGGFSFLADFFMFRDIWARTRQ